MGERPEREPSSPRGEQKRGLTAEEEALVVDACRDVIDELDGKRRRVAVEILAEGKQVHSRPLAAKMGLSHQRIGQIAETIAKQIDARAGALMARGAGEIDTRAGAIASREAVREHLASMFGQTADGQAAGLARWCLRRLTRRRLLGGSSVRLDVPEKVRRIRAAAMRLGVHGTVETNELGNAAGLGAGDEIEQLGELAGMATRGGWTAVRTGKATAIRMTLLEADRPLTAEEIGSLSGIAVETTRLTLRNRTWAKKLDSRRWALADWNLPVFRGIGRRAIDLLTQAGGRMARQELKSRLETETGRSRSSVAATLSAPRFTKGGKWIELAEARPTTPHDVRAQAHGIDPGGNPYVMWKVPTLKSPTRVHIAGIGHALAAHAGCQQDRTTPLEVIEPAGCRPVSLTRYLHKPGGTTIGRLRPLLERLDARRGEVLRVTLQPGRRVRIERAGDQARARRAAAERRRGPAKRAAQPSEPASGVGTSSPR